MVSLWVAAVVGVLALLGWGLFLLSEWRERDNYLNMHDRVLALTEEVDQMREELAIRRRLGMRDAKLIREIRKAIQEHEDSGSKKDEKALWRLNYEGDRLEECYPELFERLGRPEERDHE